MADLDRSEAFCRRLREAVGDRADLLFGTHGQFTPSGAIRLAQRIAPYAPLWFEEPMPPDAPLDLARVAAASPVPIAAGERLTTKAEFAVMLRAGGVGVVQPSLGRVGGLLEARKVAVLAEGFGVQVAPHLYAGPIAWAAAVQLALSIPNFLILETIGTGGGFHAELLTRPIVWEEGYVLAPEGPGLGVEIDEAVARAHPWEGERLHLEMSREPHGAGGGGARSAGEWKLGAATSRRLKPAAAGGGRESSSQAALMAASRVLREVDGLDRQAAGDHLVGVVGADELAPAGADGGEVGVPGDAEHLPGVAGAAGEVAGLDAAEGLGRDAENLGDAVEEAFLALVVAAVGQGDVEEAFEDVLEHLRLGPEHRGRCGRRRCRSRRRPGGRG